MATALAAVLAALFLCLSTLACSPAHHDVFLVQIDIADGDGATPARFRVIATSAVGQTYARTCNGPDSPSETPLRCTDSGVALDLGGLDFGLEVKAKGQHHASARFSKQALQRDGSAWTGAIVLRALPAFEVNEDYATGFAQEDGLAAFSAMSYRADSELGRAQAVKFYIADLGATDPSVYFQNTPRHPLHYDFVRDVLGKALTTDEFVRQTYEGQDRAAYAGTVVYYPAVSTPSAAKGGEVSAPLALTFFSSDDLTPGQALTVHRLLEERLLFASLDGENERLVYLPAGDTQERDLEAALGAFRAQDALWLTWSELHGGQGLQILNPGLAYGTLRVLGGEQLASTVVSFHDILVLTSLPNDLPIVGGTITEVLQTPLAHVNVAAHTRGTPNIAVDHASADPRIAPWIGQLVRFEVKDGGFLLDAATLAEAQAFWDSRVPNPTPLPFDVEFTGLPRFAELSFEDSLRVGAKAANLAEIRAALPEASPDGFAIPFHYYDEFMATAAVTTESCAAAQTDCETEGRALAVCQEAAALCEAGNGPQVLYDYVARVLSDDAVRSDSSLREAVLDGLRHHMRNVAVSADFAALLDAEVAAVFGSARVRLRSSTNAEDLPGFSGAGLYESVGAAASGPDAASLEVRKVWASVWNWRAHEERAFFGIDHDSVRMGVAVTTAFPDERANGVLITQNIADPFVSGMYVNVQAGEVSVTNPEGGALPEVFSIIAAPHGVQVARQRFSSLSPQTPLLSDDEIVALYEAALTLQLRFAPLYEADPYAFALDIEFKLHGPQRALFLKQARPYNL